MMSLKDDLIAAKALIDTPRKWAKSGWGRSGRLCALQACAVAAKVKHPMTDYLRSNSLADALGKFAPPHHSVLTYNDHWATRHADIMALFDRAIKAAA